MTAIVIIAIVALVLAVVAAFFISTGGGAAGRQELERQFSLGCFSVCGRPDRTEINLAASFPEWAQACEQLYSVQGAYLQCLDRCGAGCLKPLEPCEYLCAFRSLVTDFDAFCSEIKTGSNTAGTYGSCDCSCPQ
jgi:hypothetical protein